MRKQKRRVRGNHTGSGSQKTREKSAHMITDEVIYRRKIPWPRKELERIRGP